MDRNLSGIFFRHKKETGRYEPTCFEDLPEDEQDRVMADNGAEWLRSLAKQLGATIKRLGDEFDIVRESEKD